MNARRLWVFVLVAALMAGASVFGKWAQPTVRMADQLKREPLGSAFPERVGEWALDRTTVNMPLPPDVAAQVQAIYTEVVDRTYVNPQGERMMVTVAYGRDQSDGFKVHRPEVCYAAQGFEVKAPEPGVLNLGGRAIEVINVDTHKESRFEPVTYWMVIGDKVVNSASKHKLEQIRYAFGGVIADGLLVRVSSFSGDAQQAYKNHEAFVRAWMAQVPASQRDRLFGV